MIGGASDHLAHKIESPPLVAGEDANARVEQRQLSERQRAIISCLCMGDSNKTIAGKPGTTEAGVKVHMREIMRNTSLRKA